MITSEDLAYFRLKIGESTMDECLELTKYLKGKLDEQELIMLNRFGFEYLMDFVRMREEQTRQLTDGKELLEYLQTQPALLQLLEDILMTPKDCGSQSDQTNKDAADYPRMEAALQRSKVEREESMKTKSILEVLWEVAWVSTLSFGMGISSILLVKWLFGTPL